MSSQIFVPPTPQAPAAPQPLEARQRRAKQQILQTARQQLNQLSRMQKEGIAFMWANPDGLTAQEVCDAVGTDAATLIIAHGALTGAVVQAATAGGANPMEFITLPTYAFTVNPDGTVTVLSTPYAG